MFQQEKHRGKVKEKLDKCIKEKLMDFCEVLNIPISKAHTRKVSDSIIVVVVVVVMIIYK